MSCFRNGCFRHEATRSASCGSGLSASVAGRCTCTPVRATSRVLPRRRRAPQDQHGLAGERRRLEAHQIGRSTGAAERALTIEVSLVGAAEHGEQPEVLEEDDLVLAERQSEPCCLAVEVRQVAGAPICERAIAFALDPRVALADVGEPELLRLSVQIAHSAWPN